MALGALKVAGRARRLGLDFRFIINKQQNIVHHHSVSLLRGIGRYLTKL